jgi:ATP-dependent RNA helicase DDX6/DHH1
MYLLLFVTVHLIVATPGRILDLLNKDLIKRDDCKVLVLDEVGGCYTDTVD